MKLGVRFTPFYSVLLRFGRVLAIRLRWATARQVRLRWAFAFTELRRDESARRGRHRFGLARHVPCWGPLPGDELRAPGVMDSGSVFMGFYQPSKCHSDRDRSPVAAQAEGRGGVLVQRFRK